MCARVGIIRNVGPRIEIRASEGHPINCWIEHKSAIIRIPFHPSVRRPTARRAPPDHEADVCRAMRFHFFVEGDRFRLAISWGAGFGFGRRFPNRREAIRNGAEVADPVIYQSNRYARAAVVMRGDKNGVNPSHLPIIRRRLHAQVERFSEARGAGKPDKDEKNDEEPSECERI